MLWTFVRVLVIAALLIAGMPSAVAYHPAGSGEGAEAREKVTDFVQRRLRSSLGHRRTRLADAITRAILSESERHGFDPLLVMAVIQNESGFSVRKRGRHGEIGLMQLKPATARWVARRTHQRWRGKRSLENPAVNVGLGTAYMALLRDKYQASGRLYLSAYNMGSARLNRCLRRRQVPAGYAERVLKRRSQYLAALGLTAVA